MQSKEVAAKPVSQCVRDLRVSLARLYNNENKAVQTRISELHALAQKFMTGWPFKNNPELTKESGLLVSTAEAYADRLYKVTKAKYGRSAVGEIEDMKKFTTAKSQGVPA